MYDPFFRADNFQNEPWYNDFRIFMNIGVCKPAQEHLESVKAALLQMGYTNVVEKTHAGEIYLVGQEEVHER